MDTMKLLLGTIIALLLAALLMAWYNMNQKMANLSSDEAAALREQLAAIKAEQQRQLLERQYNKGHNEGYSEASAADSSLGMMG